MRDRQDANSGAAAPIDPVELAAILAEVRRAVSAVDADTGEFPVLRDIAIDAAGAADTVAEG